MTTRNFSNRQMAAALKKLGLKKSRIQMTKHGLTYEHPEGSALFTFAKNILGNVMISAPDDPDWTVIIMTEEKWNAFQANPWIVFPFDSDNTSDHIGQREFFLCVARGYAEMKSTQAMERLEAQS